MIFVIEYDRQEGRIVTLLSFDDRQQEKAEAFRLDRELQLYRENIEREVVLLDAQDEAALRRTHRRYFENPEGILRAASGDGR